MNSTSEMSFTERLEKVKLFKKKYATSYSCFISAVKRCMQNADSDSAKKRVYPCRYKGGDWLLVVIDFASR